jgi:hypothetical protein
MAYELLSLFFFVAIADHLHLFINGAMCAAGTLFANSSGYPALILKLLSFLGGGLWLILNHLDQQFEDYPLLRLKYLLLLPLCLLILAETGTGLLFFAGLDTAIITSCCATIFDSQRLASELIALPVPALRTLYFLGLAGVFGSGLHYLATGRGTLWFGLLNLSLLPVALAAIVSFFCLYFYELPTHHCPFCLLQREYHYIGYALYLSLLAGTVTGAGVGLIGIINRFRALAESAGRFQQRLAITALSAHAIFALLGCYPMIFSEFRL